MSFLTLRIRICSYIENMECTSLNVEINYPESVLYKLSTKTVVWHVVPLRKHFWQLSIACAATCLFGLFALCLFILIWLKVGCTLLHFWVSSITRSILELNLSFCTEKKEQLVIPGECDCFSENCSLSVNHTCILHLLGMN